MKKVLCILSLVLFVGIISANAQCCSKTAQGGPSSSEGCATGTQKTSSDVKAYYFHGTFRCATCNAVEDVSKTYIKDVYGDKVPFQSLNVEDDASKPLVEKYKITGQTLLIVKGEKTVNLTNDAFLNARTKPEKLEGKIKATIDSMM